MVFQNELSLIVVMSVATLLPFMIAAGSCFIKFNIVFSLVRNAIGLQQVPSNMVLHGIALFMTAFVMMPVFQQGYTYYQDHKIKLDSVPAVIDFANSGLTDYKRYLTRYADPDLVKFFENIELQRSTNQQSNQEDNAPPRNIHEADVSETSLFSLMPAYALSEIRSAFEIGFYIYLPFIVVDLIVSNILLALGMMMMSPITISLPIKLILFVAMDGWSKLTKGLILQYADMWK